MIDNQEIGRRIALRRKELDLTLENVSSRIGVARSTIFRYEKGTIDKVKMPVMEAIAKALGVGIGWLLGETDDPSPLATPDDELASYLEQLKNRSDLRMLFSVSKNATKEDVMRTVAIIEALKKEEEGRV